MDELLPELDTTTGITVQGRVKLCTDFDSMRTLVESGMRVADVAKAFKVDVSLVKRKAKELGWLTPAAVGKMRKELAKKAEDTYRKTGKAADINAIKAEIWEDRGEALKEQTYEIVKAALEGVTPEKARKLIQNPLGLAHITTVVRQITGEEAREEDKRPALAVNIGLLRSSAPVPIQAGPVIDVE